MTATEIIDLPRPTSQTITGPKLSLLEPNLVLEYDYQHDDGSLEWIRLTFRDVVALEYCRAACCTAEHIDAYSCVLKYPESDWLNEVRHRLRQDLDPQIQHVPELSYPHWRIYFDSAACVDVIARALEIG